MKKILLLTGIFISTFLFSQITIGNGTLNGYAPIYPFYNNGYTQSFYPKNSIGNSGQITGITYSVTTGTTLANSNMVDVYLGTTTKDVAANTTDWVPLSSLTNVFSGTISVVSNKVTITFTTPFNYDYSAGNLVVAVKEYKAGYDSSSQRFVGTQTSNGAVIYRTSFSDTTVIDPANPGTGTLSNILPNITLLGINPPTVPLCTSVTTPANNATNQVFLPKISYSASAGATKYYVSVGTTDGGTDVVNKYDNGTYLDYFFTYELQPQTKYYVKIVPANQNGEAIGCTTSSFTTGTPVVNDNCGTAEVVSSSQLPLTKNVDGSFASDSEGPVKCGGTDVANDGLWYELTGNGGDITVKVTPISFWNPAIVVKETSCTNTDCLLNVNAGSYGAAETAVITNSVVGRKYYVNVGTASPIDFTEGTFTLNITTSVVLSSNETNQNKALRIYPNPVKNILNVDNLKDSTSFEIIDISGKVVTKGIYKNGVNIQNLSSGKYILKLQDGAVLQFLKN